MANSETDHFWRSFETMLECPKCKKRLTGSVYMCGTGHSICTVCTKGGTICNICYAPYTKIPNLLVEKLLSNYDNFKAYLKDLSNLKENSTIKKKIEQTVDSFNIKDGKYRCWMTDQCSYSADVLTMMQHFKNAHMHYFHECPEGSKLPFQRTWEMNYYVGKIFDRAIKIEGLVFIIHISINASGELGACVLMYTHSSISDQYACQIEIECANEKLCYKSAKVISASSPVRVVLGFRHSGLQIVRNRGMYKALRENQLFKCTVRVGKKNEMVALEKNLLTQKIKKNLQKKQTSAKKINDLKIIHNDEEIVKVDNVSESSNSDISVISGGAPSIVGDELTVNRNGEVPECILS